MRMLLIDGRWQDMTSRRTRLFERYRALSAGGFYIEKFAE